jgi:hypothetical protein
MTTAGQGEPRRGKLRRGCISVVAGLLFLGCCALLPCASKVRDGEGWVRSAVSVQRTGEALRRHHEVYGHLPPAVVTGKDGKPLYSWRVALLPFLEEDALYKQFHLDEPWDSRHNKPLLEQMPRCYQPALGGDDPPGRTRYQVFVGPGAAFERPGLTWDDFPDPANTILVVEAATPVPWAKPVDLVYDPTGPLPALGAGFSQPVHFLCYEVWRRPGFNACFGDGSTRFIRSDTDEKALRGFITRGGSKGGGAGVE